MDTAVPKKFSVDSLLIDDDSKDVTLARLKREIHASFEGLDEERGQTGGEPEPHQPVADRGLHRRCTSDPRALDFDADLLRAKQPVFAARDLHELGRRRVILEMLERGVFVALDDQSVLGATTPKVDDVLKRKLDLRALVGLEPGFEQRAAKARRGAEEGFVPRVRPRAKEGQALLFAELGSDARIFRGAQVFGNTEVSRELGVLSSERAFHPRPRLWNHTLRDPEEEGGDDDRANQAADDDASGTTCLELIGKQRHVDRRQRTQDAWLLLARGIGAHRTGGLSAGPQIGKGERILTPLRVRVKTPLPLRWT